MPGRNAFKIKEFALLFCKSDKDEIIYTKERLLKHLRYWRKMMGSLRKKRQKKICRAGNDKDVESLLNGV